MRCARAAAPPLPCPHVPAGRLAGGLSNPFCKNQKDDGEILERKKRKKRKTGKGIKRAKNVSWLIAYTREVKTVVHARLDRQSGVFTEVFPSVRRR
jgi:hypothetical protein